MAGQLVYILIFLMPSTRLELRTRVHYISQWSTKLVGNKGIFFLLRRKEIRAPKIICLQLHPTEEILQNVWYISTKAAVELASYNFGEQCRASLLAVMLHY
jgi:hypothetical protein